MENKPGNSIFSLIGTIPDRDTTDQCVYGSAYPHVMEKLYQIGQIEEILRKDAEKALREMLSYPDFPILSASLRDDPYQKIGLEEDARLEVIQSYLRKMAALDWCEARRQDVIKFGRIIGSAEKGKALRQSGRVSDIWERSVHFLGQTPIGYRGDEHR